MIERLRSAVRIEIPSSLQGILRGDSEGEGSVDSAPDRRARRDPAWSLEERVVALLAANDGRMWQQSIVAETGYSEAQISRLLGSLEDRGIVDRHWNGGEKVVVLERDSTEADHSELASPL